MEKELRFEGKPTVKELWRVHVFLFPERVVGEQEEALYDMVRQQLPKECRRKI